MIREIVLGEIRAFVAAQDYAGKRVLDFGCGVAPYREIVESGGGEWVGYNRGFFPGGSTEDVGPSEPLEQTWDVILCNQVIQYVENPPTLLAYFLASLSPDGTLILTYPTCWPEVEESDLFRFTRSGMEHLLSEWRIIDHVQIGAVPFEHLERLPLIQGVVAKP